MQVTESQPLGTATVVLSCPSCGGALAPTGTLPTDTPSGRVCRRMAVNTACESCGEEWFLITKLEQRRETAGVR